MKKNIKKITNIEDFAMLMQQEFLAIHEKMDAGFLAVDKRFDAVDKRFDRIEQEIRDLRNDIEEMKLRDVNMVYRFEFKDFERRLKKLELKLMK